MAVVTLCWLVIMLALSMCLQWPAILYTLLSVLYIYCSAQAQAKAKAKPSQAELEIALTLVRRRSVVVRYVFCFWLFGPNLALVHQS